MDTAACVHLCKRLNEEEEEKSKDQVFLSVFIRVALCLYFPDCNNPSVHLVVLALCDHEELQKGGEVASVS